MRGSRECLSIDFESLGIWFAVRHKMPTSRAAETIVSRIQLEPTDGRFFADGSRLVGTMASILRASSSAKTRATP
jgi:hypothetical protein